MPFVCNRLDKEYLERRREVPFLTERPSHYVKRIYVATQPIEEPERLRDIVTLMELYDGEDTTVLRLRLAAPRLRPPDEARPGAAVGGAARRRSSARTRWRCSGSIVTVVGTVADFPEGTHRVVTVDGREVGVFNIGGRLYGLLNRCAHQGGPLCAARADDRARSWPTPRAAGSRAGSSRARSSPARGTGSSTTCRAAAASPSREIALRRYDVAVEGDDVVVSPASSRRPPAASGP